MDNHSGSKDNVGNEGGPPRVACVPGRGVIAQMEQMGVSFADLSDALQELGTDNGSGVVPVAGHTPALATVENGVVVGVVVGVAPAKPVASAPTKPPTSAASARFDVHLRLVFVELQGEGGCMQPPWRQTGEDEDGHRWEWISRHFPWCHIVMVATPVDLGVVYYDRQSRVYNPIFDQATQKWTSGHFQGGRMGRPSTVRKHKRERIVVGPVRTEESMRTMELLLRGKGTIEQQELVTLVKKANTMLQKNANATVTAVRHTPEAFDAAWRAGTAGGAGGVHIIVPPPSTSCCNCSHFQPKCDCVANEAGLQPLELCARCSKLTGHVSYPTILCGYERGRVGGGCYAMHQAHAAAAAGPRAEGAWLSACAPDCRTPGYCRILPNPFYLAAAEPSRVPLQPWRARDFF